MSHEDLCRQMSVARGPVEYLRPINAGLLFFSRHPEQFFQRAWIQLAVHQDESGRSFVSKFFKGPLHHQIEECLSYLKTHVLRSSTVKVAGLAKATVFDNWPYEAIEEVLVNAVYHKSYQDEKAIEVQVFPDRIEVLSYPGPLPPLNNAELTKTRVIARDYRNRRIGDMLRELSLTEGFGTGIPLVRNSMLANGSPLPVFYTDEDCTLFWVTLPCHPNLIFSKIRDRISFQQLLEYTSYIGKRSDLQAFAEALKSGSLHEHLGNTEATPHFWGERLGRLLQEMEMGEKGRAELFAALQLNNETRNYEAYLHPLMEVGWVEMTLPDKPNSRNQRYRLSDDFKKNSSWGLAN